MGLTVGTGPFGRKPTGRFDFEPPERITFVEVHPRRVRALKAGDTVVDSERVRLVYRTGSLPRFAFPAEDVRATSKPEPAVEGYVTVAWGDVDTVRGRVDAHLQVGADHVCIQPLPAGGFQLAQLRELAPALLAL